MSGRYDIPCFSVIYKFTIACKFVYNIAGQSFHPFLVNDVRQCSGSEHFRVVGNLLADTVFRFFPALIEDDSTIFADRGETEIHFISILVPQVEEIASIGFLFHLFDLENGIESFYKILSNERPVPVGYVLCFVLPITPQRFGYCLVTVGLGECDNSCTA